MKKVDLELLNKIEKAEVSPFLYQKILLKTQEIREEVIQPKFAYAMAFGFLLLLFVNISLISNNNKQEKKSEVLEAYQLQDSNYLY